MKKLFLTLFLLMLAACGNDAPKHAAIAAGSTVLVLGDSLSYGTGASEGEDYPTLLSKITGWNIINEGVPGDTSAGGLERLPGLLEEHTPKLLVIELGGNDFLQNVPNTETISNLKAILSQAKSAGVTTVLVAIPEFNRLKAAFGKLSDHPLYTQLAEQTNTPLITEVFSDVLSDVKLKSDPVHANAMGYAEVAKQMQEKLKELGFTS